MTEIYTIKLTHEERAMLLHVMNERLRQMLREGYFVNTLREMDARITEIEAMK